MGKKPQLNQHLAPRLILNQALTRSLEILQMPHLELATLIEEEIEKNPLLELEAHRPRAPSPNLPEPCCQTSLHDSLLSQVRESFSHPHEQSIGEALIHHLDERGFLSTPLEEIANLLNLTTQKLESHLHVLQTLDPPGIFARNLQESFLLQLKRQKQENTLLFQILSSSFDDLLQGRYTQIKKKHRITALQLSEAIHKLSTLSTRPTTNFDTSPIQPIQPDLRLNKIGGQWIVEIIEENLPQLRLNTEYLSLSNLEQSEKETLRLFTATAKWLIRSIEKRKKFLLSLSSYLVKKQSQYLNQKGPLTLILPQELAEKFSVHESTIYRALSEKYLATPTGLISLSTLVSSPNEPAKELLQKLIAQENKECPLTDDQIALEMKKAGCEIARRTIAKYRKQLNIRSASARKNFS